MSFKIENNSVLVQYNEIWNKIKKKLNIKFYSQPVYDGKYIKTKVKTFLSTILSLLLNTISHYLLCPKMLYKYFSEIIKF